MYLSLLIAAAVRGLLLNCFERGMNSISKCYEFQSERDAEYSDRSRTFEIIIF